MLLRSTIALLLILNSLPAHGAVSATQALDSPLVICTFEGGEISSLDLTISLEHAPEWLRPKLHEVSGKDFLSKHIRFLAASHLALQDYLKQNDLTIAELPYGNAQYDDTLYNNIKEFLINKKIKSSTDEVRDYHDKHAENWMYPEKVTLQHIFARVSSASTEIQKQQLAEKMQAIYDESVKTPSFEVVAQRYAYLSEGSSKPGAPITADLFLMNEAMQSAINQMKPGEISRPFMTPHGWEIVKLRTRIPATPMPFEIDTIRAAAADELTRQKRDVMLKHYQTRIDTEMPLKYLVDPDKIPNAQRDDKICTIGDDVIAMDYLYKIGAEWSKIYNSDSQIFSPTEIVHRLQWIHWAKAVKLDENPVIARDITLYRAKQFYTNWLKAEIEKTLPVPAESELRAYYAQNQQQFLEPVRRSGWMLTIRSGVTYATRPISQAYFLRKEMLKKQKEAQKSLSEGMSFKDLVIQYSTDPDEIASGGYLPLASYEGLVFDELAQNLAPGTVSKWKITDDACYIASLEKSVPPGIPPYEECIDKVRKMWKDSNEDILRDVITEQYLSKGHFVLHKDALDKWDAYAPIPEVPEPPPLKP